MKNSRPGNRSHLSCGSWLLVRLMPSSSCLFRLKVVSEDVCSCSVLLPFRDAGVNIGLRCLKCAMLTYLTYLTPHVAVFSLMFSIKPRRPSQSSLG